MRSLVFDRFVAPARRRPQLWRLALGAGALPRHLRGGAGGDVRPAPAGDGPGDRGADDQPVPPGRHADASGQLRDHGAGPAGRRAAAARAGARHPVRAARRWCCATSWRRPPSSARRLRWRWSAGRWPTTRFRTSPPGSGRSFCRSPSPGWCCRRRRGADVPRLPDATARRPLSGAARSGWACRRWPSAWCISTRWRAAARRPGAWWRARCSSGCWRRT